MNKWFMAASLGQISHYHNCSFCAGNILYILLLIYMGTNTIREVIMNPIYEFLAPASKTINNLSLVFFLKLLNC